MWFQNFTRFSVTVKRQTQTLGVVWWNATFSNPTPKDRTTGGADPADPGGLVENSEVSVRVFSPLPETNSAGGKPRNSYHFFRQLDGCFQG